MAQYILVYPSFFLRSIDAHWFIVTCLPISRQLRISTVVAIHSSAFNTLLHCSAESKPARFKRRQDGNRCSKAALHCACDNSHQSQRFDGRKLRLPVHLPTEPEAEGHQCVLGLAHSFILVHLLDASRRFAEEPQTCMSH